MEPRLYGISSSLQDFEQQGFQKAPLTPQPRSSSVYLGFAPNTHARHVAAADALSCTGRCSDYPLDHKAPRSGIE